MTSYKEAGVDIDAGNNFVNVAKDAAIPTYDESVYKGIGGFCSLTTNPVDPENSLLASSTDGVGSKILAAKRFGNHFLRTIGQDLVAMVVNDIITVGARPMFFLDYYGTPKIDDTASDIIYGIARGCKLAGCALVGGETAEMPLIYDDGKFDLVGFGVGEVKKSELPRWDECEPGDAIIGIASSGPHSNGYTIINRAFGDYNAEDNPHLTQTLMAPTRIYVNTVLSVMRNFGFAIKGIAHITGGGLEENTNRVIHKGLKAKIDWYSIPIQPIFSIIKDKANMTSDDLARTFNCGIGMVFVVNRHLVDRILAWLNSGYTNNIAYSIGSVVKE
jgi:phosphoribosylformylglycinamidine cyclo-ligase